MKQILAKLRALFRKEKLDRDLAEEMRFHIDERTDDHVADGLRDDEARYAAQRKFGNVVGRRSNGVRSWRSGWMQFVDSFESFVRAFFKPQGSTPFVRFCVNRPLPSGKPAFCTAILACGVMGHALPAFAQVDQQRAQEYFKEAQSLGERDDGRLWGVSLRTPMVIGDARTQTFATSQPPPDAPRPRLIGLLNGPIEWGGTLWAAITWDTIANWPARTRGEAFLHESFHVIQRLHGIGIPDRARIGPDTRSENEHLDALDGRYWLRLEWRALARALQQSGEQRAQAVSDALAFRQARLARYPEHVVSEYALDINEGLPSYTQTVLAAPSATAAIARGLELLAEAEQMESFVRTFAYKSGPAYGLLLDAASPGWTRKMSVGDEPAVLLMRALGIQPAADAASVAARYGGAELRALEEQRDRQRQAQFAELRRRFVESPLFVMPGGGSGLSNSQGAVVLPDAGTIYFGAYRMSGPWGTLDADKGVLVASDGSSRRLPAPARPDGGAIAGDGWTFKAAPGWVVREGARPGDYEVVRQQP